MASLFAVLVFVVLTICRPGNRGKPQTEMEKYIFILIYEEKVGFGICGSEFLRNVTPANSEGNLYPKIVLF